MQSPADVMAGHYGSHANEIARAGAIGQILHMTGPTSAPLWVLLGLVKADLGDFQKHALRASPSLSHTSSSRC
ncbi:hypothetical protein ACFVNB_19155 [Streptomyces rochei]|uniref:hypothetical protein n=2 Tax=Streptomyces rochei TaxID=1928 RepID=UPI0036858676